MRLMGLDMATDACGTTATSTQVFGCCLTVCRFLLVDLSIGSTDAECAQWVVSLGHLVVGQAICSLVPAQ